MLVDFELKGVSDLLFHADDVEQSDILAAWRADPANKDQSVRGDDRSPPWTWQTYLYHDAEQVAWPSDNVMVCLRQAGAQLILKKTTTFKQITQSGLTPTEEFFTFLSHGNAIPLAVIQDMKDRPFSHQAKIAQQHGFRLFAKRAKIGQAKHIRVRARFSAWAIRGQVKVNATETLTRDRMKQLFDLAGDVGLGDWRPGCKTPGVFGRFTAALKFKG